MSQVSAQILEAYNEQYSDANKEWREIGARYKALNVKTVTGGKRFGKLLEIGCGDGAALAELEKLGVADELYGLEISESGMAQLEKRNLKTLEEVKIFDGYDVPYPDDSFDLVVLTHVLEHVEFERPILREMYRLSEHQVIEVPKDDKFHVDRKLKHFMAYGHINVYTPSSLRFLLGTEGLNVVADHRSIIAREALHFNKFKMIGDRPTFFKKLKIDLEYALRKALLDYGGEKRADRFCNAYTVLTKRAPEKPGIF